MIQRLPWHPVLFASAIVVTVWLDAAVSPYAAARSLGTAIGLAVVLALIGTTVTRSLELGAAGASLLIGLLWSKQLAASAADIVNRMGPLAVVWIVLIGAAAGLGTRILRRKRRTIDRHDVTVFLNRASMLLLIAAVIVGWTGGRLGSFVADLRQGVGPHDWPARSADAPAGPDIYAVLLDGYPRADVLRWAFDISNDEFLEALAERGFDVASSSHSDYMWTHLSVPSALNLAYVEQIPGMAAVADGKAPLQPTMRQTAASNEAFDVAREHGYTTVAVASGFEHVAIRRSDVYLDDGGLNEFEISLLSSTYAGDIVNAIAPGFAAAQQRERIRQSLAALPQIAAITDRGPAFVFAHVPAPHQPTVFGDGGAPVDVPLSGHFFADSPVERGQDETEFRARYRAQLPYLNDLVLSAIDGILARSRTRPVIVLFADHGSASKVDWTTADVGTTDPARVLERTGTLFAALTPGHPNLYPNDISPVDIFRLLFDAYLGTQYGRATPPADGGQTPPIDASVLRNRD